MALDLCLRFARDKILLLAAPAEAQPQQSLWRGAGHCGQVYNDLASEQTGYIINVPHPSLSSRILIKTRNDSRCQTPLLTIKNTPPKK